MNLEALYQGSEGLIALGFVCMLLVAGEVGFQLGRATGQEMDAMGKSQLPSIQAALLGLLALLLGFTTAMAVSRFETRQRLVVEEANAIGTAALRARLVPGAAGAAIVGLLRDYADARAESSTEDSADPTMARRRTEELQAGLWSQASAAAQQDPRAVTSGLLLQALNEMIDVHGARRAALRNHVPVTVMLMIGVVAMITLGAIGYGYGIGEGRHVFAILTLAVAITLVVMVILDLDRPQRGFIRVSERSLIEVQENLRAPSP